MFLVDSPHFFQFTEPVQRNGRRLTGQRLSLRKDNLPFSQYIELGFLIVIQIQGAAQQRGCIFPFCSLIRLPLLPGLPVCQAGTQCRSGIGSANP